MNNDRGRRRKATPAPAGSDHLHPEQLRVGSIGVFAADHSSYGDPPRFAAGYVGTLLTHRDEQPVFCCTRQVTESIIVDNNRVRERERARLAAAGTDPADLGRQVDVLRPPIWFDGDDVVCDESARAAEPALHRWSPAADGRYVLHGTTWSWTAADPAVCDHITGQLPAAGAHQELVAAVHNPLLMPHSRLAVTALQDWEVHDGVAYVATLCLDGEQVGTIENKGGGSPTVYYPVGRGFWHTDMEAFVASCWWQDGPASQEMVLEALISDFETNKLIAGLQPEGLALVVLRGRDGGIADFSFRLDRYRLDAINGQTLAVRLTLQEAHKHRDLAEFRWEVWRDGHWQHLGTVTPLDRRTDR